MGCSPKGVLAVQFHNRSSFVTEDIEICQSYMTVLSSSYQCLCFTPMESSAKAMIISCLRSISRFDLEIQCPLAKMSWKNVNHHGWPTKKTCQRNSLKLLFLLKSVFTQTMCIPWSYWSIPVWACNFAGKHSLKRKLFLSLLRDWKQASISDCFLIAASSWACNFT